MNFTQTCIAVLKAKGIDDLAQVTTRSIRIINKIARERDEGHLYPYIPSADRAIRWFRRVAFAANGPCSNYEYILGLEARMSDIVNGRT
jgi:hypothetical protein